MAKIFYTDALRNTGLKVTSEIDEYKVVYLFGTGYAIRKMAFSESYFIRELGYGNNVKHTLRVMIQPCKMFNDYKVTIVCKEVNGRRYESERYLEKEVPTVLLIARALIGGELGEELAYSGERMVVKWEEAHTPAIDVILEELNRSDELAHDDMFYSGQRAAYVLSLQVLGREICNCKADDIIVGKMVGDGGKYTVRHKVVSWVAE